MSRVESVIDNWPARKEFMISVYRDAMEIALAVAGVENPNLAQIILAKAPTMIELIDLSERLKRDK